MTKTHRFSFKLCAASLAAIFATEPLYAQINASRFVELDIEQTAQTGFLPRLASQQTTNYMVVMSENSVAQARTLSPTHTLTDAEHGVVVSRVKAQHDAIRPHVEGHGAEIITAYHGALNGFRVNVTPSKLAAIASIPGVSQVLPIATHHLDNSSSVPYLGTPAVWQSAAGLTGERIKVAIIDSGIDYTHANFGGPGTREAYLNAAAQSTNTPDPRYFGPGAPKVKGGIDFVGDNYNPRDPMAVAVADPNPLDCMGHGTHVAGTVAGFGVTQNGATYTGAYDESTYRQANSWRVGPGVAPRADLYAVRVFGCIGSTNKVVDAIEWSVLNHMDVINMSLGSSFGTADSADALAATQAARAGIVVVASAGNDGPGLYVTGAPATADGVISVAAIDGKPAYPGARLTLAGGKSLLALDSNDAPLPPKPVPVVVLRNPDGTVSLGCNPAEYAGAAGKLVVTQRGSCARVDRAYFGQAAGAAGVAMINNASVPDYPPFEGPLEGVTIPFLGVPLAAVNDLGSASVVQLSALTIPNPNLGVTADFSSGGPRNYDGKLKPTISAPGLNVSSSLVTTGSEPAIWSGTSMAAPHVAGVAALTRQAHPTWKESEVGAAIAQTADPAAIPGYQARVNGGGLVQPLPAAQTNAIVTIDEDKTAVAISFGVAEFSRDFKASRKLRVVNKGDQAVKFSVGITPTGGDPHELKADRSEITVGAREETSLEVRLTVPGASAGSTDSFNDVSGVVTLTPVAGGNHGVALRVPYYMVERVRSGVMAELKGDLSTQHPNGTVAIRNAADVRKFGTADFYALGLLGTVQGAKPYDVRAVGVQTFPFGPTTNLLVFAVNTFQRFSNAAAGEIDIYIDIDGDGNPDFIVYAIAHTDPYGYADGKTIVGVYNLKTGSNRWVYYADAPTDGSTILMPIKTSALGLSPSNPRFSYQVVAYNNNSGLMNFVPGIATFNAFTPAISNGDYVALAPGASANVAVEIDPAEWQQTPAKGIMVVERDNFSGEAQASLLKINR